MTFLLFLVSLAALEYIRRREFPNRRSKEKPADDSTAKSGEDGSLISLARALEQEHYPSRTEEHRPMVHRSESDRV